MEGCNPIVRMILICVECIDAQCIGNKLYLELILISGKLNETYRNIFNMLASTYVKKTPNYYLPLLSTFWEKYCSS